MAETVSQEIQKRVEDQLTVFMEISDRKFGVLKDGQRPTIAYNLRGRVAGRAYWNTWFIKLNAGLLNRNVEEILGRTLGHEYAHLITHMVYTKARQSHGPEFKSVCRALGISDKRCHSMDTSETKVRKVTDTMVVDYECSECGHKIQFSLRRHNALYKSAMTGRGRYRFHTACGSDTQYKPVNPNHWRKMKSEDFGITPAYRKAGEIKEYNRDGSMTKMARAVDLYRNNWGVSPRVMKMLFTEELGMTHAGASTYYYKAKTFCEANRQPVPNIFKDLV